MLAISFLHVWFCFARTTLMGAIAVGKARSAVRATHA
jgi:hypothetical protein